MFKFLRKQNHTAFSEFIIEEQSYINSRISNYLYLIKDKYGKQFNYIKRPNLLINIIERFVHNGKPIFDIFEDVENEINFIRKLLGRHDNTIYKNNEEYFFFVDSKVKDIFNLENVKEVKTVTCFNHNVSDIMLNHPLVFKDCSLDVVDKPNTRFFFGIDVLALCLRYSYWSDNELTSGYDNDPARFITTVVYTEIMDEVLEIAFFNRLIAKRNNNPVNDYVNYNHLKVFDFTNKIDKYIKHINKRMDKNLDNYYKALNNIPTLLTDNIKQLSKLPETNITKFNAWLILLTKIDFVTAMFDNFVEFKKNQDDINDIINEISILLSYKYFDSRSEDTDYLVNNKIKNLQKILSNK